MARKNTSDDFNMDAEKAGRQIRVLASKNLISPTDWQHMRNQFADFLGLVCVLNEALQNADCLESGPKPVKKRRRPTTISGICKEHLDSTKAHPVEIPMPEMELELLMHNMVEEKIAKPIPSFNYVVDLPDYRLRKRRSYVTRVGMGPNAEKMTFTKHWAVLVKSPGKGIPPLLMLIGQKMTGGAVLLTWYNSDEPEDTLRVYEWVQNVRHQLSPFRGNICMWEADGFQFNNHPRQVTWADIVPNEGLVKEFDKCLHMLKNPQDYRAKGLPIKRGLILAGPPGTGKTMHLECLISQVVQAKLPVFQISNTIRPSELNFIYNLAEEVGPALVILDDIDTITAKRQDNPMDEGGHSGNVYMLNALLNVLDGSEKRDGVITVATTNHPQALDRALGNRPGRFDRTFKFLYPSRERRIDILNLHAQRRDLNFDPGKIIKKGGADYDWILEKSGVTPSHLAEAIDTVVRDMTLDEKANQEESFLEAIEGLKESINSDDRFTDKEEEGGLGFQS